MRRAVTSHCEVVQYGIHECEATQCEVNQREVAQRPETLPSRRLVDVVDADALISHCDYQDRRLVSRSMRQEVGERQRIAYGLSCKLRLQQIWFGEFMMGRDDHRYTACLVFSRE